MQRNVEPMLAQQFIDTSSEIKRIKQILIELKDNKDHESLKELAVKTLEQLKQAQTFDDLFEAIPLQIRFDAFNTTIEDVIIFLNFIKAFLSNPAELFKLSIETIKILLTANEYKLLMTSLYLSIVPFSDRAENDYINLYLMRSTLYQKLKEFCAKEFMNTDQTSPHYEHMLYNYFLSKSTPPLTFSQLLSLLDQYDFSYYKQASTSFTFFKELTPQEMLNELREDIQNKMISFGDKFELKPQTNIMRQ